MAKITHKIGIKGPVDRVFATLTSNEGFSSWWASSADIKFEVGGKVDLTFHNLAILRFEYKNIQENKSITIQCVDGPGPWQDSELIFALSQSNEQVFLTLTHQNAAASEEDFLYFNTKWVCYLISLRDLVETGKGRPFPNEIKIHVGD